MRYRRHFGLVAAATVAAVLCGCALFGGDGTKSKMKEQPLQLVDEETPAGTQTPSPTEGLMDALKRRQDELASASAGTTPPAAPDTASAAPAGTAEVPEAAPSQAPADTDSQAAPEGELSVARLLDALGKKPKRTPAEDEAYRRLLGVASAPEAPPAGSADEYALLGEARDALLAGRASDAQDKASAALERIRQKTDPTIDRVVFAWQASNYGDAELAEPADFKPGQLVLAVTDLSNFACLPVPGQTPPALYYTKMTQRLAIYDTAGKLYWEHAYGPFEYQASHYFSTMFVPVKVTVPQTMKPGEYVLKVEIDDVLAGRQAESSARFSVK